MSSAAAATCGSTTWSGFGSACHRIDPSGPTTDSTGTGSNRLPPVARVPYALAISNVFASFDPSTALSTANSGFVGSPTAVQHRMPIVSAVRTTVSAPSCWISCAYTVLTESSVAVRRLRVPYPSPSALVTFQTPPPGSGNEIEAGAANVESGEYPCSSAATRANALNAEPV